VSMIQDMEPQDLNIRRFAGVNSNIAGEGTAWHAIEFRDALRVVERGVIPVHLFPLNIRRFH